MITDAIFAGCLFSAALYDINYNRVSEVTLDTLCLLALIRLICCDNVGIRLIWGSVLLAAGVIFGKIFHRGLGGGDIKLLLLSELYLGPVRLLNGTILGIVTAGAYCLIYIIEETHSVKDQIPLCPFLFIGLTAALLL